MPILDLSKHPLELQLLNITAIMCWPSDKQEHNNYILQELLGLAATQYCNSIILNGKDDLEASRNIGSWLGKMIYEFGGWPSLADATVGPGQKKSPIERIEGRITRGIIIGRLFFDALLCRDGISKSAARFCSDKNIQALKQYGVQEKRIFYHPQNLHSRVWPQYKDSAHLWATFIQGNFKMPITSSRYFPLDEFDMGIFSGIKDFVGMSEQFRQ
jgi:hypothetical protein